MSEVTDLTVIEIKPEQAPALYTSGGLAGYLEQIREMAKEVPDVTTKKGRDRIGSLARMVGSSKTAIEKPGREYLKRLKEAVKPAEEELRIFTRECDAIRDAILKPREEWEAEQERIKAEESAKIKAEEDRKKFESDHEIALLMNDAFDRELAEKEAEEERQRIAHEEELKRQAAEQAKREAEEKAAAELAAAKKREEDAIAARAQAELLAKQERERAEYAAAAAAARAEREKQEAIEAEKRKAEAKEAARLAEEKRIADEKAKREADVKHRKAVGTEIVNALTANTSISRDQAIEVLKALMDGLVPRTQINY